MRKFFYDNYTSDQVPGIFSGWHFFTIALFVVLMTVALYFSRNFREKQVQKVHWIVAIVVTALEILKISLRVYKGQGPDSYVPLYYCSLFLFAIWASLVKVDCIRRAGYSFICMGGIMASAFFTLYPSTSLAMYPIWHPSTWHSFFYHAIMFYCGVVFLWKGGYKPKAKDAIAYFLLIFLACIPAYFLNETIGTNCMFLRHPFGLPFLDDLLKASKWGYIATVFLAQSVAMFWGNFGIYQAVLRLKNKRKIKKGEV